LTWKHPLDNSEITGNPEVIAGAEVGFGEIAADLLQVRFWTTETKR
jgi:hypothetical protein